MSSNFRKIHKKSPVPESFFINLQLEKNDSGTSIFQ